MDTSRLDAAIEYLASHITERPVVALVLGSGLGNFAESITPSTIIDAGSIPYYPTSTVPGHEGKLTFGRLHDDSRESLPLLIFKGRVHYYETGDLATTTFPINVAQRLGARYLLATNAAGGINPKFAEGDLMLIEDFINLAFLNPHQKPETEDAKTFRIADSSPIDEAFSGVVTAAAEEVGVTLRRGTYCWLKGPSYETKAEIEMLRRLGADAVGMSTVPEMLLAKELGMRVAGISLISNMAAGLSEGRLSHEEVSETASRVNRIFSALLKEIILRIENS